MEIRIAIDLLIVTTETVSVYKTIQINRRHHPLDFQAVVVVDFRHFQVLGQDWDEMRKNQIFDKFKIFN